MNVPTDRRHETGHHHERKRVARPPDHSHTLFWLGPGTLWLVAEIGPEVLFGPRVGARYGYSLIWVLPLINLFIFAAIRETARYTIATDKPILNAYGDLPGPRGWAVWLLFVPQVVQAMAIIAGIASLAASAVTLAVPGGHAVYAVGLVLLAAILVVLGRYERVDRVASIMAGLLLAAFIVAAFIVVPSVRPLVSGLIPSMPAEFDLTFLLPWFASIGAGPPAIIWFSYWVARRGFGGGEGQDGQDRAGGRDADGGDGQGRTEDPETRRQRIRRWARLATVVAAIGAFGSLVTDVALVVLGAEILRPEGIVPQGIQVARDLSRLLADVWGPLGFWLFVAATAVALWGTVLSHQDGWGRMFADATLRLLPKQGEERDDSAAADEGPVDRRGLPALLADRGRLRSTYVLIATAAVPLALYFIMPNPVDLLTVGGIVQAAHYPVVFFLTLYVNYRFLPKELRPSLWSAGLMVLGGLFFTLFSAAFFLTRLGLPLPI